MIVRARLVVTMDGPPIENGAVAISGDRIVDVGKLPEITARNRGETIDLGEQALLPGLINAHCHLDYTCLRGKIGRQKSFTDWIRAINAEKAGLTPADYVSSINQGFTEAKHFGTTSIANLTAFSELISRFNAPVRTWWFPELIDVRTPELLDVALESLRGVTHGGLAPHAPFTASADLYQRCERMTASKNILLTTHLAESREEMSMFRDASGPLYDFLKSMGRNMNDCGAETPLGHFLKILSAETKRDWTVAHLNELTKNDLDLLRGLNQWLSIVHCPRSHDYFGHSPFQFQDLRDLGFNICLGTDSLASNDDLSLFAEMRVFQKRFKNADPLHIFEMVTVRPAFALGQPARLGRIRQDCLADLIAVPCSNTTEVFESIIAWEGPVTWSMIGGVA